MPAYLSPIGNSQIVDVNGNPLNGGKIRTFLAGMSTPADAYTTSAGAVLQPNPIILNSLGWSPNPLFLKAGVAYKIIFEDAAGVQIGQPFDNITGINDPAFIVGTSPVYDFISYPGTVTYLSPTSVSLIGDQTGILTVGRALLFTSSSATVFASVKTSVFASGFTTIAVTLATNIPIETSTAGMAYGSLRPTHPSLPNSQSQRDALGVPRGSARNLIRNPNFLINQDNLALNTNSVLVAGAHWFDGWKAGAGGCTVKYDTTSQVAVISTGTLVQIIEGNLSSIPNSESFYTFTANSANYNIGQTSEPPSVTNTEFTKTTTLTAFLGNVYIVLGVGSFSGLQLEAGKASTPIEPRSPFEELIEVQRYYEPDCRLNFRMSSGPAAVLEVQVTYKVTKRAVPTVTINAAGTLLNIATATITDITTGGFRHDITANVANTDSYIRARTFKVDARL